MSRPPIVRCPHCQTEIPVTWDGLPPDSKPERIVVTCYACGDRIDIVVRPEKEAEAAR